MQPSVWELFGTHAQPPCDAPNDHESFTRRTQFWVGNHHLPPSLTYNIPNILYFSLSIYLRFAKSSYSSTM